MFFKVQDLMINVADKRLSKVRRGSAGLCWQVAPTPDTCGIHSPYVHIAKLTEQFREFNILLGKAFTDPDAIPAVHEAAEQLGRTVVAAAARGGTAYPDPNCADSEERIPPTLTPIVHGFTELMPEDLPKIKASLRESLAAIKTIEDSLTPEQGIEREVVVEHLDEAVKSLQLRT